MLPVGDRPVVDYVVEECAKAGIKDIYIVTNDLPVEQSQIQLYYGKNIALEEFLLARGWDDKISQLETVPSDVNIHFALQSLHHYGTAMPVAVVAEQFGVDEPIVFCNGDDFFWGTPSGSEVKTLLDAMQSDDDAVVVGVEKTREEIAGRYGMLEVADGLLTAMVEKPPLELVTSTLTNVNRFVLSRELMRQIVQYTKDNDFGPRDQEYMITDPIQAFVAGGGVMRVVRAEGQFMDCGNLPGWLRANRIVCGE